MPLVNCPDLFIGRYNFDKHKLCDTGKFIELQNDKIKSVKHPKANITLMTAHLAKGLGYVNVIILNMFENRFGFPCQLEDDPIMKLVRYEDMSMPFAEERRLFYGCTNFKSKGCKGSVAIGMP